jgi:hypothetical protein
MGKWLTILSLAVLAVGCSSSLEDGYKPRLLGASDDQRRGYYAAPFTPQAQAADQDAQQQFDARRPHPGY